MEPKQFMVSLNPPAKTTTDELRERAKRHLESKGWQVFDAALGDAPDAEHLSEKAVTISNTPSAVDIAPVVVHQGQALALDKSTALKVLAQHLASPLGLTPDEVLQGSVAIGDSSGDRPMLELCGIPACPSDARDSAIELVRRRGGYVSPHPWIFGVVDIISRFSGACLEKPKPSHRSGAASGRSVRPK